MCPSGGRCDGERSTCVVEMEGVLTEGLCFS